ncbi:hypothetical protein FA95DRAFT_1654923 [Auriscalpium vulgare]|uniref:Uncharacterized protein n=1 Tax=Auriscalpium vulgare TaxID=40419 RepID=A0ACB8RWJ1_9AGAM|nr:hypothetical protein FA95DRAFT_1654923 [Auriscalpium vulgare]
MDFLSQTYVALRGPTGAPQTPDETVTRLADRLSPSTLLADRRAAVLALKGLARAHKQIVADRALPGLLDIIQTDADVDPDIGRAAIECVSSVCDTLDLQYAQRDLGYVHTDRVLENDRTVHKLLALLADQDRGLRHSACLLLTSIVHVRPQKAQAYFLKAPVGPGPLVGLLEEPGDVICHAALNLLSALIRQSPEIQKVLAFDGVFEKLFAIVTRDGGLDSPNTSVEEALKCVDTLLRFNTSNQSYFRETPLPALLASLLYFDPNIQPDMPVPQEFALQFWNSSKAQAAALVLEAIGILLGSKGTGLREGYAFTRLLIEMAMASNAPTRLKVQCLRLLPASAAVLLPDMVLSPYMPVPETNGEEWDRLEEATGIDALLELIMHGEYNGLDATRRQKEGMDLRGNAVGVFENFLLDDRVKEAIVTGMLPPSPSERSPVTPLLFGLILPPNSPLDRVNVTSLQFASVLFAHLIRHNPTTKALARQIVPPALTPMSAPSSATSGPGGGAFFVPADGAPPPQPEVAEAKDAEEEEEDPQTLLQLITEHLALAFLSRSRAGLVDREQRECDRVICMYLALLSQWLWEDPQAVRVFLEAGGLGVLVEQLNQPSELDVVVPGLCAFLLGICYEFNREPGEITRATMYPLLTRLGADVLAGRTARVRDDERIKVVGPDFWVLPCPTPTALNPAFIPMYENETEVWFDWAFVEFWKSNNNTIQRSIVADPESASSSAAQSGEESVLVASLRTVIAKQSAEIEALQTKLKELSTASSAATKQSAELASLQSKVQELSAGAEAAAAKLDEEREALEAERAKRAEVEKEQEDLLVLLDELSSKRARDKVLMREKGLDVSEDEGDDDEDDEAE